MQDLPSPVIEGQDSEIGDLPLHIPLAEAQKQAEAILVQAKAAAEQERQEIMDKMSDQLKDLVLNAAEKIMLKDQKDPYQQFLDLAEREGSNGKEQ